jgi:hypothetical protein
MAGMNGLKGNPAATRMSNPKRKAKRAGNALRNQRIADMMERGTFPDKGMNRITNTTAYRHATRQAMRIGFRSRAIAE